MTERLELLARGLGFNDDAEIAAEKLDAYADRLPEQEAFALVHWIGYDTEQKNFREIAVLLNVEPKDVKLLKDNAVARIRELMARDE